MSLFQIHSDGMVSLTRILTRRKVMGDKGGKKDKDKVKKQKQQDSVKKQEQQKSKLPVKKPA
jgi:hypothetical protein